MTSIGITLGVTSSVNITRTLSFVISHLHKNQIVVPFACFMNSKASTIKDKKGNLQRQGWLVSTYSRITDKI